MSDSKIIQLNKPVEDPLHDVLQRGARELLAKAVEAELNALLTQYSELEVDGKKAVVRNGHLPARTIQTGLGDIPVKVPKVRDRSGQGIKFNSALVQWWNHAQRIGKTILE